MRRARHACEKSPAALTRFRSSAFVSSVLSMRIGAKLTRLTGDGELDFHRLVNTRAAERRLRNDRSRRDSGTSGHCRRRHQAQDIDKSWSIGFNATLASSACARRWAIRSSRASHSHRHFHLRAQPQQIHTGRSMPWACAGVLRDDGALSYCAVGHFASRRHRVRSAQLECCNALIVANVSGTSTFCGPRLSAMRTCHSRRTTVPARAIA